MGGWFFVRNAILYDGDIFGMRTSSIYSEMYALDGFKPSQHYSPDDYGISPLEMMFSNGSNSWLVVALKSSVGVFGMLNVFLPRSLYLVYGAFFVLGMVFSVRPIVLAVRSGEKSRVLLVVCLILAVLIPFVLSVYYSWSSDYRAQGRYFSSGFIPFFIFITVGYDEFAQRIASRRGKRLETSRDKSLDTSGADAGKPQRVATLRLAELTVMAVYLLLFVAVFISTIEPYCMG